MRKTRKFVIVQTVVILLLALALRAGSREVPPYDDLYHMKRMEYSAAHLPHVLEFDPDRAAFCPWPPLYDLLGGLALRLGIDVTLVAPIAFALFAALVGWGYGW